MLLFFFRGGETGENDDTKYPGHIGPGTSSKAGGQPKAVLQSAQSSSAQEMVNLLLCSASAADTLLIPRYHICSKKYHGNQNKPLGPLVEAPVGLSLAFFAGLEHICKHILLCLVTGHHVSFSPVTLSHWSKHTERKKLLAKHTWLVSSPVAPGLIWQLGIATKQKKPGISVDAAKASRCARRSRCTVCISALIPLS